VEDIFFGGFGPLLHTLVIGALSYPLMLVMLRTSGNRTLSKMNAFDLVVTVALAGSAWRPRRCGAGWPRPARAVACWATRPQHRGC
jgi:hypothetical protein